MNAAKFMHEYINAQTSSHFPLSILDVCCGDGAISKFLSFDTLTGIDVYEPYLFAYVNNVKACLSKSARAGVVNTIQMDLQEDPLTSIVSNSYDVTICLDGVEHLDKAPAVELIHNLERIAKKMVFIFTPVNVRNPEQPVLNTPKSIWGINGGDEWQSHKSAHQPEFFVERGYTIEYDNRARNVYDGTMYRELFYHKILSNSDVS